MIIRFPNAPAKNIREGDLIAITRDDRFVGYGQIVTILEEWVLVDVDKNAGKTFNEIFGEAIPHSLEFN